MRSLRMIKDYKNNDDYRGSFNSLAIETFGLDFQPWYEKGYWNDHYICYSMIDGDRVVANASINHLTVLIDGEEYHAIQIGTVMTHPDYRKRGLGKQLMEAIYKDYDEVCDFYYLFGNDFAYDFYVKLGFTPVQEHTFTLPYTGYKQAKADSIRQLSLDNPKDEALIKRVAKNKRFLSRDFAIKGEQHLLLFYMLYVYTDEVYYIEEHDAIVVYELEEGILNIVDVLCEKDFPVNQLIPYIATEDVQQVTFQFTPNIQREDMVIEELHDEDSTTMFRKVKSMPKKPFRFSELSHA